MAELIKNGQAKASRQIKWCPNQFLGGLEEAPLHIMLTIIDRQNITPEHWRIGTFKYSKVQILYGHDKEHTIQMFVQKVVDMQHSGSLEKCPHIVNLIKNRDIILHYRSKVVVQERCQGADHVMLAAVSGFLYILHQAQFSLKLVTSMLQLQLAVGVLEILVVLQPRSGELQSLVSCSLQLYLQILLIFTSREVL
jgi:hypothetical protein